MSRSSLALAALGLAGSLQAAPLTLDSLLLGLPPAPAERLAVAELAAQGAAIEQRRAEASWQLFGSATAGSYHELGETEQRDDYYGRNLALGVRHPLLGSLQRRLALVQAGLHEQERQRLRLALLQAQQRLEVRSAYADWWRAQEERRVCQPLTEAAAAALRMLQVRRGQGWMLPSEADGLRSRWQGLQRRCATVGDSQAQAVEWLAELAGRDIPLASTAMAEPLASRPQPLPAWLQSLERHPRVIERQSRLAEAGRQRELPWYALLESSISLSRDFERRSSTDQSGGDWVASLDVSAPFDVFDYGDARRREGEARYRAAEAALEDERHGLRRVLAAALRSYQRALEDLRRQRAQLEVARRRDAERRLRGALEGEAGVARRQEAELDVHEAALQQVAAWHALWLGEAALRVFADDADAALLGGADERWQPGGDWSQGVYIWDSRALLDARRRPGELRALREAGMRRLYLGLSAAQVARLPELRGALQALLREARDADLEPLLLLGEPGWLLPAQRAQLADLLQRLADLPFAGLHLDLEVEQLGWPVPEQRLRDWLDTLALAVRSSPWPLELSSHPRWFAADAGVPCVPCALPGLGVHQVSLMIYTANTERSAALAGEIARRWPALRFRLAQSIEPQLPASESLAGHSRDALQRQARQWQRQLQSAALGGIDWQAWQHYPPR
ncbi:Outer membrane efflux protein [compost metagenome]